MNIVVGIILLILCFLSTVLVDKLTAKKRDERLQADFVRRLNKVGLTEDLIKKISLTYEV